MTSAAMVPAVNNGRGGMVLMQMMVQKRVSDGQGMTAQHIHHQHYKIADTGHHHLTQPKESTPILRDRIAGRQCFAIGLHLF